MLIWMLYVLAVSLLLGGAALAAERSARLRRRPSRWYWIAAIVLSLLVPTIIASVSVQLPDIVGSTAAQKMLVLRDATSAVLSPQLLLGVSAADVQGWRSLDVLLRSIWLVVSVAMLLAVIASGMWVYTRKRSWRKTTLAGREVLVSFDVGPAVVGLFKSRIVVPEWLAQSPANVQSAVLAHEQAHLNAGDPQLFTLALALLIFMPWNMPLWWQLRRLRNAIEVDCDARVLDGGHDAVLYSETLIAVGERQSAYVGAVAAMSESPSFLEQRIAIMISKPVRWWRTGAAATGLLAVSLVGMAMQVSPPNASSGVAAAQEITLEASVLDRYVGYYKMTDKITNKVTHQGTQLFVQLTGQPAIEVYPRTTTSFFLKVVPANIDFLLDEQGVATSMVLHQNGQDIPMTRMDPAAAQQQESELAARLQVQAPSPGTEAALRRSIAAIIAGQPNYEEMDPKLAELTRTQLSVLHRMFTDVGPMQSLQFAGVNPMGADVYSSQHPKGVLRWQILLASGGKISLLGVSPGP